MRRPRKVSELEAPAAFENGYIEARLGKPTRSNGTAEPSANDNRFVAPRIGASRHGLRMRHGPCYDRGRTRRERTSAGEKSPSGYRWCFTPIKLRSAECAGSADRDPRSKTSPNEHQDLLCATHSQRTRSRASPASVFDTVVKTI